MQAMTRRSRVAFITFVILAAGLRCAYPVVSGTFGRLFDDTHLEYVLAAKRLVIHGEYLSPWPEDDAIRIPSSIMPPIYTLLVAGVYKTLGIATSASTLLLQFINIIASTLVVPLVFATTRRLANEKAAWVAALITGLNPLLIGFCDYMWDTAIFSMLVALVAYVAVRICRSTPRLPVMFGFGAMLGFVALLNPALTIAYPILVAQPILRHYPNRPGKIAIRILAAVFGFAIVITPWTLRNYAVFDRPIYVRNGFGLQLWLGVCPGAESAGDSVWFDHYPMRNPEVDEMALDGPGSTEMAYIDQCTTNALSAIRSDPVRWLRLCATRSADFWLGTVLTHSAQSVFPNHPARLIVTMVAMGEVAACLLLLLYLRRVPRDVGWLITTCLLFSVVYCTTITMLRFRSPIEPIIAIVLALCVHHALARHRGDNNNGAGVTTAVPSTHGHSNDS